ncbi:MAG: NAD(P)H-hydrate dehydratase [Candidatus Woykebacteria bacterium RBG_16_44_10]|uniref:ADP-dependent (S)-NAD(P)H-hydrate dehydratase n=1 Tax=Candidatus Woykebacteria bacterium RBG_16_44_10 TaxID=1802597 RepID=A0A1G1WE46_9BACT|nr:MAG: NAD(P)H-hydrate dehydratase [Candidatus Woykebacteria bacterium RBG_16_44_10]
MNLVERKIGVNVVKSLYQPPADSHKGQNGVVLIIGGSEKFHGAPLFAAKIASKIVDLVYFSSVPENNELIKKMKSELCDFIAIPQEEVFEAAEKADAVLVGPGLGAGEETTLLTNDLLKRFPNKKFVLDADAFTGLDKNLLGKNCIVTPHKEEFKELFGIDASKDTVIEMAKKYGCIIALKGVEDCVSNGEELRVNATGNAGMTKGGTGDVLAGLIAALACKNDLFLVACAGVFINGTAGDRLKEKVSYYYNASDLVEKIPKTIKKLQES